MKKKSSKVPKNMRTRYDEIVAVTDPICMQHLSDEYAELARYMIAALARKRPSPINNGRAKSWACGIVYALGQVNFLFDQSQDPHLSASDLCKLFGVAPSTGGNKAKSIRDSLNFSWMDADWCLPSRLGDRSSVWYISINGLIIDARGAPVEIQRIAYEKGLIPYVYADARQ